MLRVLTESGIEFQIDTPILVKDFFIFSVLENLTETHSFADNRVLFLIDFLVVTVVLDILIFVIQLRERARYRICYT